MPDDECNANDSKSIKVYVRILPLLKRCDNCMKISPDEKTIFVRCLQKTRQELNPLYWSFKTDGIFYDCSQRDIYRETTDKIIDKVMDGGNCVVISCGQTGTGKSFTTGGLRNNWEHRGLVPRILADLLLARSSKKRTNEIHCSLSFVEFRGRNFRDLLNPNFPVSDNSEKRDSLKNVTRVSLKSEKDGLRCIFRGEGRRTLTEGSTYPACHLGTAVITFHVRNTSLITSLAVVTEAAIHVVEMAGIDAPGKSSCSKAARDVIAANIMKLEMEHFFSNSVGSETIGNTFGRSSRLIKYLRDPPNRTSVIRLIAHVRVTREDLDVTLSILRSAAKICQLRPLKISYKIKPHDTMTMERLYDEIARLKRELDVNEKFFDQEAVANVSKNRAEQIEHDFISYLNGSISEVKLLSLGQAQVLTKMMKDLYEKMTVDKQEAQENVKKCETRMKNDAKNRKTMDRGFTKDTIEQNEESRDRLSRPSTEAAFEIEINKVGELDNSEGITLGPGLIEIPASSALRALNTSKTSRPQSEEQRGEKQNEKLEKNESRGNIRKTFEVMQRNLSRSTRVNILQGRTRTQEALECLNSTLRSKVTR